jgi:SAM-dependent methyltransferase
MSLVSEYRNQWQWRDWARIFEALPLVSGQTVLDLGCGPGDQGAALAARGARVFGADARQEFLCAAQIPCVRANLRALPFAQADGIWGSSVRHWIALVEIDDRFGHEPLSPIARAADPHHRARAKVYCAIATV